MIKVLSVLVPVEPKAVILGLYPPDLSYIQEAFKFINMCI